MEHSFSSEQLRRVLSSAEGRQLMALLASGGGERLRQAADAAKPEWYVFATHWRQVGWDTPGGDAYEEGGFYSNQVSPATTR